MRKEFKSHQVINATDGELWYNGQCLAQVKSCKIEIDVKTTSTSYVPLMTSDTKFYRWRG